MQHNYKKVRLIQISISVIPCSAGMDFGNINDNHMYVCIKVYSLEEGCRMDQPRCNNNISNTIISSVVQTKFGITIVCAYKQTSFIQICIYLRSHCNIY